jgi:phosphopantetheinyl transferase
MPPVEQFLTASEMRRYESFKIDKRRNDWALGRYALKKLLKEQTGLDFKRWTVDTAESGAPFALSDGKTTNLRVSISHSNGYGAACFSLTNKVGIDIELIEERSKAWAEMCFTKTELARGADAEYLTELWAKKEAVSKILNIGLTAGLHQMEFDGNKINFYGRLAGTKDIKVDVNRDLKNFITAIAFGGIL